VLQNLSRLSLGDAFGRTVDDALKGFSERELIYFQLLSIRSQLTNALIGRSAIGVRDMFPVVQLQSSSSEEALVRS
jgi:hypothetical protein